MFRTDPSSGRASISGQALQKHGEHSFSCETLREMTFKIWPLRVPEMTIFVSEFKLHKINDVCKRELVSKSEYLFYHDEDEDLAKKLRLTVYDSTGQKLFVKYFSQFSSFNASYNDDESYLPEMNYIYEDVTVEELYKNEDLSGIFNLSSQFSNQDGEEQGGGLQQSQERELNEYGDFYDLFDDSFNASHQSTADEDEVTHNNSEDKCQLLPASDSDERPGQLSLNSSHSDAVDLVPASPDPSRVEDNQFEDLISMPLLYKY